MSNRDRGRQGEADGLMRPPAERSGISSFIVMDVMRAAAVREAAGRSVIHMEVGQPATARITSMTMKLEMPLRSAGGRNKPSAAP